MAALTLRIAEDERQCCWCRRTRGAQPGATLAGRTIRVRVHAHSGVLDVVLTERLTIAARSR